jgi:hypothetical protein
MSSGFGGFLEGTALFLPDWDFLGKTAPPPDFAFFREGGGRA